jgi:hypothetical protein
MRGGQVAGWTALTAAVLTAAGALLPIPPQLLASHLDEAFGATLHFAAAHRYAVGTQLISTFGPLGFVFYDTYFPATFAWLLVIRATLAAATCGALAWIGYAAWGSPWGATVAVLACAPFMASPDVWFLLLPFLVVLIELPAGRRAPLAVRAGLGIAVGLVGLIKATFLLAALAALGPLTAASLVARRRLPVPAAAALLAAAVAWVASGQSPVDAVRYLDWSLRDVASGYASAMQLPADALLTVHAGAVSLAVFLVAAVLIRRRLPSGRSAAVLALAAMLFLLFKAGFVRADVHVFITVFGLLVLATLLALLWDRRPARVAVAVALVALLPGLLWAHAIAVEGAPFMYFPPIYAAHAIARLAATPFVLRGDALAQAHARRVAVIRAASPLPPLPGPVDVYSYDQAVPLAHALDFRPRPVFHSYMAYTPRLARANADVLLDARAPEWILFRVATVDHRLPALDDAPSWPLLLTRYRLVDTPAGFALLQRRDTPLQWRLESLGRVDTETKKVIPVPSAADGPIWARVDLHETHRDALVAALLSAPVPYLGVAWSDGRTARFRLVSALARDGFLLSPVVENTADFIQLMSGASSEQRAHDAVGIMVQVGESPGIDVGPRAVSVELFRLRIGG